MLDIFGDVAIGLHFLEDGPGNHSPELCGRRSPGGLAGAGSLQPGGKMLFQGAL